MNIKNRQNILKFLFWVLVIPIFMTPLLVFGQCADGTTSCIDGSNSASDVDQPNPSSPTMKIIIENPFKEKTIEGLITTLINDILIPIGAVVAVVMVMYAGFLFVTARGNTAQIDKAKGALLWAVIGAAILLGAWVIAEAIKGTVDELRV